MIKEADWLNNHEILRAMLMERGKLIMSLNIFGLVSFSTKDCGYLRFIGVYQCSCTIFFSPERL